MEKRIMIYGAYGFTGKLIANKAVEFGMRPILAGRNEDKLEEVAHDLDLDFVVFDVNDMEKLDNALRNTFLILNAAGPFSETALPIIETCFKTGTHYLDITGEIFVFQHALSSTEKAKASGVCLIPGVGFDVVPSDCLAATLNEKLPDANYLELAFHSKSPDASRGTLKTIFEGMSEGVKVRKAGRIVTVRSIEKELFFGEKLKWCEAVSAGDIITAYKTTGIPNIVVYASINKTLSSMGKLLSYAAMLPGVKTFGKKIIDIVSPNPQPRRKRGHSKVWGEVSNVNGIFVSGMVEIDMDAYSFTASSAVFAIQSMLEHLPPPGFSTPSQAFGSGFCTRVIGVRMKAGEKQEFR